MDYKQFLKNRMGDMPIIMNMYWYLVGQHRPWRVHYNLDNIKPIVSQAVQDVLTARQKAPQGKRIFLFSALHYWIEHVFMMGLALAGKGHQVSLGYLPYAEWQEPVSNFDLRRQDIYTRQLLRPASEVMQIVPLLDVKPAPLTVELKKIAHEMAVFDTQYTLQIEEISPDDSLYQLRYERNLNAALIMVAWLEQNKPDVVIIPNGSILELGVLYKVCRSMNIDAVTYEYGDMRETIWLAKNQEIMRQNTDDLWAGLGGSPLTAEHRQILTDFFTARKNAQLWGNYAKKWQEVGTEGAQRVKQVLKLDDRPVVLLATNVLGDSLMLGRQVISQTMADWIKDTIAHLLGRQDIQVVIRVHPDEVSYKGTSMVQVIKEAYPQLPDNFHVIGPAEKVNTYDLMEVTRLGLVFTTTAGLEMALAGIPVITAGQTHYRGRGFTNDPASWNEYISMLDGMLADDSLSRLSEQQLELTWRYAYLFFFEYALSFPWHVVYFKEDIQNKPLSYVLGEEGQRQFGETLDFLAGEPIQYHFNH